MNFYFHRPKMSRKFNFRSAQDFDVLRVLNRLLALTLFEGWVLSPTIKEVDKSL